MRRLVCVASGLTVGLVSICITNHNYGRWLSAAIDSCLAQRDQPVEVVVVDDGSTDNSWAVLASYGTAVTALRQANQGQLRAALAGFAASHGDVVIFLDADDRLDGDTARRAVDTLEGAPATARVQWRLRIVGPDGEVSRSTFPPAGWTLGEGDLSRHILERRTYVWPPTSGNAFPRWVLNRLFDLLDGRQPLIDLYLATTSPLLGPVVTLPGIGGSYRWHPDSFSHQATADWTDFLHDRINETLEIHELVAALAAEEGLGDHSNPMRARDWAFGGYRLASLRLAPEQHPIPQDGRVRVATSAIAAVLTQPGYRFGARLKRAAWLAALAAAPPRQAERLVDRLYRQPAGRPVWDDTPDT